MESEEEKNTIDNDSSRLARAIARLELDMAEDRAEKNSMVDTLVPQSLSIYYGRDNPSDNDEFITTALLLVVPESGNFPDDVDEGSEIFKRLAKEAFKKTKFVPRAVCLVSDANMVKFADEDEALDIVNQSDASLRDHPNAVEALTVVVAMRDRVCVAGYKEYKRSVSGEKSGIVFSKSEVEQCTDISTLLEHSRTAVWLSTFFIETVKLLAVEVSKSLPDDFSARDVQSAISAHMDALDISSSPPTSEIARNVVGSEWTGRIRKQE